MSIHFEQRGSDSPYIDAVTQGYTACAGAPIRPAENCWHMVFVRVHGKAHTLVVGPLTTAGVAAYSEGAEILWIRFGLGTWMPHLPARSCLDVETVLPGAVRRAFWLKGTAWPLPDFANVEIFVERLVREEVLVCDPVVTGVLQGQPQSVSPRTLRDHFLRATGLSYSHIRQVARAQQAAELLRQGRSILDTVDELGYFDQPHLTRSLKQWAGYTPAQIIRMSRPDCHSVQDSRAASGYDMHVVAERR
jgi:hypothetical protein